MYVNPTASLSHSQDSRVATRTQRKEKLQNMPHLPDVDKYVQEWKIVVLDMNLYPSAYLPHFQDSYVVRLCYQKYL